MEILIRPWQQEDVPAVRRILWASWLATYRAFVPEADLRAYFGLTYTPESLARLHASGQVHGCLALAGGEPVGYARTQFHADENRLYLASLYLLPGHEGRGIGRRLLQAAEARVLAYGLRQLWVGVMVQNEAARRWYERRGFRFLREEPFRIGQTTVTQWIGCKTVRRGRAPEAERPFALFPEAGAPADLARLAARFWEAQQTAWPKLAEGTAALAAAELRELAAGPPRLLAQFNPQRIVSTGAALDPESIRRRPCFLCREHRPPEQQGILYRRDYLILCNPAPIFPGHFTVAHRSHRPQTLAGRTGLFLRLAGDFGPAATVLYNGPHCGASAPDHFHLQVVPAGRLPVEAEAAAGRRESVVRRRGAQIARVPGLGRAVVVVEGRRREAVAAALQALVAALGRSAPGAGEPMFNLLGGCDGAGWRLILFPRRRRRPAAYFREGAAQRLISPASVEMGGLFITPRGEDFRALDAGEAAEIFADVAWSDDEAAALLASL